MGWTDIFSSSSKEKGPEKFYERASKYVSITPEAEEKLQELESLTSAQTALLVACCGASFALGFKMGRTQPPWTRLTSVQDIPSVYFGSTAPFLRGRVVSVSDGDTLRFLHAPTWFHPSKVRDGEKGSEVALPVRICTIDTPETAKFGKPGQPFGEEAKEKLKSMTEGKIVRVKLLQKDQYSRAVAEVRTGFWPLYKYMDEQMLKAGLAEVYQGSGAVYGRKGLEGYLSMQEKSKKKKKGIWSQKDRESAAEFKARTKAED